MTGGLTFVIRLDVDAPEVENSNDIRHAVEGLLWKQIHALYGMHYLLPTAKAQAVRVEIPSARVREGEW